MTRYESLLAACSEWDRRMDAARRAGIPVSEPDCDESLRVRALLRVEERAVAKAREAGK